MTDLDLDALEATARAVCVPEAWTIWHDLDHQGFKTVGDAESYAEMKKTGEADECDPIAHVYTDDLAEHIATFDPPTVLALIERLERAEAALPPCDGGCDYNSGPEETCSAHGRPVAEVWQMEGIALRALSAAEERAGQAEARIAAALEGHTEKHGERARFAPGSHYLGEPVPAHWEKYVICDYCKTTWPCKTFTALTVESENTE